MGGNTHNDNKRLSAIAMTQDENRIKAVEIAKLADSFEICWAKSSQDGDANWRLFAADCGLSLGLADKRETCNDKITVVGFGAEGVAFYHLGLPAVKEDEIKSMVRMQAETLLPVPAEQMEVTWRVGRANNGQVAVTIAASRKEYLKNFIENVRGINPAKILLDRKSTR